MASCCMQGKVTICHDLKEPYEILFYSHGHADSTCAMLHYTANGPVEPHRTSKLCSSSLFLGVSDASAVCGLQ